jgi:hypothetical protein
MFVDLGGQNENGFFVVDGPRLTIRKPVPARG